MSFSTQAAARCARQLSGSVRPSSLRIATSATYLTARRTPSSRRCESTQAAPAAINPKISQIVDQISTLTLLETADLVSSLKTRLNIPDLPVGGFAMAAGGAPGAAAAVEEEEAAPAAAEKTLFNLKLESFEPTSKPKVIKEIKTMLGLSLVDSKKFVESAPKILKESVPKEEAEKLIETFKALGAKATMDNTTTSKRPFHATQTRSAIRPSRKAPSVRKDENKGVPRNVLVARGGVKLDREGFWNSYCTAHVEPTLVEFKQFAREFYEAYQTLIPPGVNLATFVSVGEQLIKLSHSQLPSASLVRSISIDVDAVYRISLILADLQKGQYIYQWALTSCAKANSRRALVELVNRYISTEGVDIYQNTECIAKVKDLALKDEFPHAIMLYAKLLIWRGENAEAARLLEQKILPFLQPTSKRPSIWEDIQLLDNFDSPWRMYAVAVEKEQGLAGIQRATRRAAVEFHDPIAMTDFAISVLEMDGPNKYEVYESYMAAAALGGHTPACFHLANFYYRTSQGEFTTEAERNAKKREEANAARNALLQRFEPLANWAYTLFNQPMDRETYRMLAMDWYELAFDKGSNEAGYILAMLFREDGDMEKSREVYNLTAKKGLPTTVPKKGLVEMRDKWEDQSFQPGLPPKLLRLA
ncbi:Tetratricopeptide-like helical [Penicillium italicum]|uniref:Tetratricopeptide-like helical n=1 Tax=Penicillium italicum TaxID=40296 RepID=A0A0A2KVY1_PENIT|nr:Tetratricopeptide-like helical [Penicillium italicum]